MASLRKQSIISTLVIFIGFAVGFANNTFFTNNTWFTETQFALTQQFYVFGLIIYAASFLGLSSYIYKFSPYYKANLKQNENDMLSWALIIPTIGFIIVCILGYLLQHVFFKKYNTNSPTLVSYYFWLFPFGYFLLLFYILESYLWTLQKSILSNFLREVALRVYILVLIVLFILKVISFDVFIKLFVFSYALLVVTILLYLKFSNQLYLTLKPSRVTKKFLKKIIVFALFVYAGVVISMVAQQMDSAAIGSMLTGNGKAVAIFTFAMYISNIIQVPQRSVIAVSLPVLATAWRSKNLNFIAAIYKRSSINLLLIGLLTFGAIWLCFDDVLVFLGTNKSYLDGKWVVFFFGLKIIIDMGTGVNGQIIGTSNFWRFEFFTGVILLLLIIPLNLFFIQKLGIVGAAISNLIAYTIYNIIRLMFLWYKFKMQPFSLKTLISIALAISIYFITLFCTLSVHGFWGICIKTTMYLSLLFAMAYFLKLSPDIEPVATTLKKRILLLVKR